MRKPKKPLTPRERLALERFALNALDSLAAPEWSPDTLDDIASAATFHGLTIARPTFTPRNQYRNRRDI